MVALRAFAALLAIGGAENGCAPAKVNGPIQVISRETPTDEVTRYMPLEDQTVFTYETHSENAGSTGILIVQVSRPREGRADLKMGYRTERLEFLPDGIAFVEGGYLLKLPLQVGARWRSKSGTVEVKAVDETVDVPAGKFAGCLRTVERDDSSNGSRTVTSTFCEHVGLVSLDVEVASDRGADRETAVLKSFGPRVDLGGKDVTTTSQDDELHPGD